MTCPQSAKRRKDTQTNRCDYDDSDAMRGAGHVARPNHRKPLVRANPNDNAQRLSLALLPSDDRRQCGGAEGLLRRLAYFPPRLVRTGFVAAVRQARMAEADAALDHELPAVAAILGAHQSMEIVHRAIQVHVAHGDVMDVVAVWTIASQR